VTADPAPRGLWRPAIVAGVLMALCFIRAMSWQVIEHGPGPERLTPRGQELLAAAAFAIPLFPAAALLWSAITRRLRTRLTLTLAGLIVLGAALAFGTLLSGLYLWNDLFEGEFKSSVTSPDGAREAHLHVDGLLGCRGSLFVSDRGALWGVYVPDSGREVSCKDYGVRWLPDGGVEVTGSPPEPSKLFFGPH
jgi:hypothetical protein